MSQVLKGKIKEIRSELEVCFGEMWDLLDEKKAFPRNMIIRGVKLIGIH
jgi:hypothetical protein